MSAEVWNVLVVKGGVVSLLKNLTEDECRAVAQRLGRERSPWTTEAIHQKVMAQFMPSGMYPPGNFGDPGRDFERVEWWGSEGSKLELWPMPADYEDRLAEAMKAAMLIHSTNADVEKARAAQRPPGALGCGYF